MVDFDYDDDDLSLFDLSKRQPSQQSSQQQQSQLAGQPSVHTQTSETDAVGQHISKARIESDGCELTKSKATAQQSNKHLPRKAPQAPVPPAKDLRTSSQKNATSNEDLGVVNLLSSSPAQSEDESLSVIELTDSDDDSAVQHQPPAKKRRADPDLESENDSARVSALKPKPAQLLSSFGSSSPVAAPTRSEVKIICKFRNSETKEFYLKRDQPLSDIATQLYPDVTDMKDIAIFKGSMEVFPDYAPEDLVDDDEDEISLEFVSIKGSEQMESQANSEPRFEIRVNIKNGRPVTLSVSPSTSVAEIIEEVLEKAGAQSNCAVLEFDHEELDKNDLIKDTEIEEDDVLDLKF